MIVRLGVTAIFMVVLTGCGLRITNLASSNAVSPAELRRNTVSVEVETTERISKLFQRISDRLKQRGKPQLAEFFGQQTSGAFGSGFVVRRDGDVFVVTNRHVVDFSDTATVVLEGGGTPFPAEVIYADRLYDLAVLSFPDKAPKPDLPGLTLATRVYLAIPSAAMERAPDAAVETKKGRVRSEWLVGQLAESCARLVGGHPSKDEPAQDLYDLMTNEVVATRGFESLDTMKKTERSEEQWSTFFENPTTTMRFAVALRLWRDAHGSAGLPVACIPVSQDTTADAVKLLVTFERGNRETQWRFEQGFWKLIGFDRMMGSAPTKPAATKPKTPLKPRRK